MTTSQITTMYEAHDALLAFKLKEIEEAIPGCVKLAATYELSRKLFALLKSESPSRQLTEGFEKARAMLLNKQNEIMGLKYSDE